MILEKFATPVEIATDRFTLRPVRKSDAGLFALYAGDKRVAEAINAGKIRRGYLKGAGMRMNCAPPAAPSWFVPEREAMSGGLLGWLAGVWAAVTGWIQGLFS